MSPLSKKQYQCFGRWYQWICYHSPTGSMRGGAVTYAEAVDYIHKAMKLSPGYTKAEIIEMMDSKQVSREDFYKTERRADKPYEQLRLFTAEQLKQMKRGPNL